MKKTVLITGATAGIGEASAQIFAQNGYRLILVARRSERLKTLAETLDTEVLTITLDVCKKEEVVEKLGNLPAEWQNIDILLNNAGLAVGLNTLQNGEIDDWERMIDTNVKGLLYVTRTIAPLMIARNEGHIINISSVAGKEVYANGNVYCASKHAVDALSKAMRMDMLQHNIKVTNVAPGMVETEFSIVRFKGDLEKAGKVYEGLQPLRAEDVADVVYYAATRPAHVCLNDILLMPTAQASATSVKRS
jgi:NADP-dependent 3-hydroxy acid dehydrogenase YdfG